MDVGDQRGLRGEKGDGAMNNAGRTKPYCLDSARSSPEACSIYASRFSLSLPFKLVPGKKTSDFYPTLCTLNVREPTLNLFSLYFSLKTV